MVTQASQDPTRAADQRPPATAAQPPVAPPGASAYSPQGQPPTQPHFGDQPPVQPYYDDGQPAQSQPPFGDQLPTQPLRGTRPPVQPHYDAPGVSRDHVAAALLAIFLGCFGVHKFIWATAPKGSSCLR